MYVTLDLSSLASGIRPKDLVDTDTDSKPVPEPSSLPPEQHAFLPRGEIIPEQSSKVGSSEQIQILGLSSSNPIISYRKQLYSCQWTAPLGTDIILKPSSVQDNDSSLHPQRKPSPVLATSKIRLTAQPVRPNTVFKDSNEEQQDHQPLGSVLPPADHSDSSNVHLPQVSTNIIPTISGRNGVYIQGTFVSISDQANPKRKNQARFLSRLEAAKRARGESDKITVHAPKPLTGAGWRTQRKELETESEDDDDPIPNEVPQANGETEVSTIPNSSPARPLINEAPRPGYSKYGRKIGRPKSLKRLVHETEVRDTIRAPGLFGEYRPEAGKKRVPGKGTRGRRRGKANEDVEAYVEEAPARSGQEQNNGKAFRGNNAGESAASVATGENHTMDDV